MALSQGTPTNLSLATTTQTVQTVKYNTNLAVTLYAEPNASLRDLKARVIDISLDTISEGAEQDVWGSLVAASYCAAAASTTQIVVAGDPDGAGTRARTMTISGTTITENATDLLDSDSNPESVRIAMCTATLGLVAYRIGGATTTARVCRITISGDTITSGSPVALTGAGDNHDIITMCALDSTRVFLVYAEESTFNAMAVVIDITSGVSIGTPVQIDTDATIALTSTGVFTCTKVDTDKIAVGFVDTSESPDQPAAIIITTSGTTIASQGTRYSIISAVADCEVHSIEAIDTSTLVVSYTPSVSGNVDIETLAVSGTTISANSDTLSTDTAANGSRSTSLALVSSTRAIFSITDGLLDTDVSIIFGFNAAYGWQHSAGGIPGSII